MPDSCFFKQVKHTSSFCTLAFIFPSSISINIYVIFMKNLPRIRGTSPFSSMSTITKSIVNKNFSTLTKMSLTIPYGRLIDMHVNYNLIFVRFISRSLILLISDKGLRFKLSPKSMSDFPIFILPIVTAM